MGFMALFSGFMYKGSYNVEVRLAPLLLAALPHALSRAAACVKPRLLRLRCLSGAVPGARHRAPCVGLSPRAPRAQGLGGTVCVCSRRRAAQVTVADSEPAESALRRFRKSVLNSGVLPEVRRHAAACPRLQRRTGTARRA